MTKTQPRCGSERTKAFDTSYRVIGLALAGLGNGISAGTMLTLGADLAPEDSRGEFLGMWRLIGYGGWSVGLLAVGGIADLAGLAGSAWMLAGIGWGGALVFGFFVPETLKSDRRNSPS